VNFRFWDHLNGPLMADLGRTPPLGLCPANPSRSLSFEFGTALPAAQLPFPIAVGIGSYQLDGLPTFANPVANGKIAP
jgi:hypothetical protein